MAHSKVSSVMFAMDSIPEEAADFVALEATAELAAP
jgi:hypothetical protein